jgi:hypothetical protein
VTDTSRQTGVPIEQIPAPAGPSHRDKAGANHIKFTTAILNDLQRTRAQRQEVFWDSKETGLSVLRSRGPKNKRQATLTFRVVYYLPDQPGKPHYKVIGRYPVKYPDTDAGRGIDCSDVEAVRDRARQIRTQAKAGVDPKRLRLSGEFPSLVERFISEHGKRNNQTWAETKRIFDRYVIPEWQDRKVEEIKKGDVTLLLNKIGEGKIRYERRPIGTPFVARAVRAQLGVFFNWYVENYSSDDFRSPIVKSRQWRSPTARTRDLNDTEIRALWKAAEQMGVYGAVIKTALLTAQRFHKVSGMLRSDLKANLNVPGHYENDEWVAPIQIAKAWDPATDTDPRNKQVSVVPLSSLAEAVLAGVPTVDADGRKDWLFSLNGCEPINGWSKFKRRLDKLMLEALRTDAAERGDDPDLVELKPWQHRDLRRTAKTLMKRAGISRDISERCLAHVIPGVEGVYDRHDYLAEKRDAFDRLAALVHRIVDPPANVVPIQSGRRGR